MAEASSAALHFRQPVVVAVEYHQRGSRLFVVTSNDHFPHWFLQVPFQLNLSPRGLDDVLALGNPFFTVRMRRECG